MKRIFTLLVAALLFNFSANAQLASGSVAPNFTVTDIDGNTHELYDILDQGKTVVIDVFATWCGPCWNYHQTHTLEDVWNTYGPNGTDEIFVMGIEADASTPISELTNSSLGNWTEGITYPMIDDGDFAALYQIAYYPTIYHICPNRIVSEAGQLADPSGFSTLGDDCQLAAGANNAGLIAYDGYEGSICGELAYAPTVTLQNLGTEEMTSATIELSLDGDVEQTINWEGTLGTYQLNDVAFDEVMLTGATEVSISIANVNGAMDDDTSNDVINVSLAAAPAIANDVYTVEITTDAYGDETYWAFIDGSGIIVAEGGNPNVGLENPGTGYPDAHPDAYDSETTYTIEVTLDQEADCYDFVVTDGFGDGMCCNYGNGGYSVTDVDGNVLFSGGAFAAFDYNPFEKVSTVSAEEVVVANDIAVFPNPAQNELNVNFEVKDATQLSVNIHNTLGQVVETVSAAKYTAGTHTLAINTAKLTNGMYMLTIQSENGSTAQKFTVSK